MRTEYLATSFFTCGEDSSQDWYKLSEAAVKFEDIPHDVQVSELFEGLTAHELQSEILYVKRELDKFKERIIKRHTAQPSEDYLEVHFEVTRVLTMNTDYYLDQIEKSTQPEKGTGGLWVLAKRITDQAIKEFDEGVMIWDDFFEELNNFIDNFKI